MNKIEGLLLAKKYFNVPSFWVLNGEKFKELSVLPYKEAQNRFFSLAPRGFFSGKKRFIARPSFKKEDSVKKSYAGVFLSAIFEEKSAVKQIQKSFESFFSPILKKYSPEKLKEKDFSLIIQEYKEPLFHGEVFFDFEKKFFFSESISRDGGENIYIFKNGNSYFDSFEFKKNSSYFFSTMYFALSSLCREEKIKKISAEYVVSRGELFIVQLKTARNRNFDKAKVRFENEENYDFNREDFDAALFNDIAKMFSFSAQMTAPVKGKDCLIDYGVFENWENEIIKKASAKEFLNFFKKNYLEFVLKQVSFAKKFSGRPAFNALRKFNFECAVCNFFYTRVLNSAMAWAGFNNESEMSELKNIPRKAAVEISRFFDFKKDIKKYSQAISSSYIKKALDNGEFKSEKQLIKKLKSLKNICAKKSFFKIIPSFPVFGLNISSGSAAGAVRIIRNALDASILKEGEIAVSSYFDSEKIPAVIKSSAVIMSAGGFLSHAAVLCMEAKKPCIGGVSGCENLFKDGQKVKIINGKIYKE